MESLARNGVEFRPEVLIRAQTPAEELDRIQNTLERESWFKQHGYTPKLPDNPQLTTPFTDENKPEKLKALLLEYKPDIYEAGQQLLDKYQTEIGAVFPTFAQLQNDWGFKVLPQYEIAVTRYGMGGSYNADTGKIIMRVLDNGTFGRTQPHHAPIHEMTHIGIEENIIKKYKLTQAEKERLVDKMVSTLFSDTLPDYKIQSIGDKNIEPFVTMEALKNLPEAIEKYTKIYPR